MATITTMQSIRTRRCMLFIVLLCRTAPFYTGNAQNGAPAHILAHNSGTTLGRVLGMAPFGRVQVPAAQFRTSISQPQKPP